MTRRELFASVAATAAAGAAPADAVHISAGKSTRCGLPNSVFPSFHEPGARVWLSGWGRVHPDQWCTVMRLGPSTRCGDRLFPACRTCRPPALEKAEGKR